jgi:ABC-type nitrate/sulfonate/bicarbonate transport system substrate-binding protein
VQEGCGVTVATSGQVWRTHPGKVLAASAEFVRRNPHTCIALVAAVLDAACWIEADEAHREAAAEVLASPAFINADQAPTRWRSTARRPNCPARRCPPG